MATQTALQLYAPRPVPEYTIYTFGKTGDRAKSPHWQKHDSLTERDKALDMARRLFDSGHFHSIEVKSRFFDSRADRRIDMTLKTFGRDKGLQFGLPAVLAFAGLCGLAMFFLIGLG